MADPDNSLHAASQKGSEGPSIPQSQATPLLTSFTTFLTLAIHSLLYHRQLYPSRTFITARAYNLPVRQSRHAGVCRWVNDAVTAVAGQLAQARVERVVFVVHAPKSFDVLERWVFDVGTFPEWGDAAAGEDWAAVAEEDGEVNWTDVNEGLRGGLRRVAYAAEKMEKPPQGSTFTVAVELRDDAAAPIAVSVDCDGRGSKRLTRLSIPRIGYHRNRNLAPHRRRGRPRKRRPKVRCLFVQYAQDRSSSNAGSSIQRTSP